MYTYLTAPPKWVGDVRQQMLQRKWQGHNRSICLEIEAVESQLGYASHSADLRRKILVTRQPLGLKFGSSTAMVA
jgi:hypothetical protein